MSADPVIYFVRHQAHGDASNAVNLLHVGGLPPRQVRLMSTRAQSEHSFTACIARGYAAGETGQAFSSLQLRQAAAALSKNSRPQDVQIARAALGPTAPWRRHVAAAASPGLRMFSAMCCVCRL